MRQQHITISAAVGSFCLLCEFGGALPAQTKPAPSDPQAEKAVRGLVGELNTAVGASDARGVRRLLYVPEKNYDFAGMQRYLEQVAAGRFKDWKFSVLRVEVEGDYVAVIITEEPPSGAGSEITPVALFKPGVPWRVLSFDLPKTMPRSEERNPVPRTTGS